ncbi:unnamed protein product [Macrosiphum euphorbiae]|uniref:Pre-C2HC domain-containing protein n=1 Tax=Macrosiphum euphorbiae TaxID=13131 RepID=A0AAV0X590_9HEMI|nr:unnamed protein product [Macrosiphum euphorbiae]
MNYLLANDEITFHACQAKSSKAYSVYNIRHLQPSTSINDIQTSLMNGGHDVIRVTNIINRFTEVNLSLFRADITMADNNSDVLKLNSILHTKVKVKLLRKKSTPSQCTNCQAYFHTTNYCRYHPRCVKFGENHVSSDCTKSPSVPAKCPLCDGPHTSSYKGCPHYKKIISKRRKPTSRNRQIVL